MSFPLRRPFAILEVAHFDGRVKARLGKRPEVKKIKNYKSLYNVDDVFFF